MKNLSRKLKHAAMASHGFAMPPEIEKLRKRETMRTLKHGATGLAIGVAAGGALGAGAGAAVRAIKGVHGVGEGAIAGAAVGGVLGTYGGGIHGHIRNAQAAEKLRQKMDIGGKQIRARNPFIQPSARLHYRWLEGR